MRARHGHHSHKLHGEKGGHHRARGGGVSHPSHHYGEGAAPKHHAGKRARGGSCKMAAGGTTPAQWPQKKPMNRLPVAPDQPESVQGRKKGGGIHIKKSHEGLLHKNLGVPAGKHIPAKKLSKALHSSNPKVKKRAVFAENAKHWHHG